MLAAPKWISRRRHLALRADFYLGIATVVAAVVCSLAGVGGAYGISLVAAGLFYATATMGWCLQSGYGGMFSLAPAAIIMIAAYVSAFASNAGWPMGMAVLGGTLSGALAGFIVALATSRLKGHYFALATLVAAEIVRLAVTNEYDVTGGEAGLRTGPLFEGASGVHISLVFAGVLILLLVALLAALRGMPGIAMQAIRDDEGIAAIRGLNVPLVKTLIVVVGSSITAFAGAVYVHYIQLATPQMGSLFQTTFIMSIGIIGGVRSMSGAIVGAALIVGLQEVLRDYPFTHMGLTALAILLVCQFAPAGFAGLLLGRARRIQQRFTVSEHAK
ncbi:branched-chain amino acid ABC transporter permease [Xanthobacter sp. VNH20]|uniref:branched-chain amino acid ABC transporter permease n=1 Tax=Xanthobacter sp. VNH20 TaxID=3156616 RepID=UPI0032B368A4